MPVEAVAPFVDAVRGRISEVMGPVELIHEMRRKLGAPSRVVSERLHRLGVLAVPGVPGSGRLASAGDLPLLAEWTRAYFAELGLYGGDVADRTARRVAAGEMFLWVDGGEPVAMAGLSVAAGGVCRVSTVYTPPARRRRGYGAAITAHVSRAGLEERCDQVVLFTDLANPVSNRVYRSIGYEPVADYAQVTYRG